MPKIIPTTQGKVAIVDNEDYEFINLYKWHAIQQKTGIWYAYRNLHLGPSDVIAISMHTSVLDPLLPGMIHHWNGSGLDNRKANLTLCTAKEHSAFHRLRGWSRKYDKCRRCNLTDRPHQAYGMCDRCYMAIWNKHCRPRQSRSE